MQNPNNPNLAESVASNNRNLVVWLAFDWGRDGSFGHPYSVLSDMVISADLDKAMSGALPPSTPFVEGTAATELRLTLGGSRKPGEPPANVVFAKYNPASPLYNTDLRNTPVVYWVGEQTAIGIAWTQQFTGWVRSAKVSADSGEVEIICLDAAQKLQNPIWLPAYAVNVLGEGGPVGGYWTDFSSHWVIDRILRANGYSTTPLPHPDAIYSATLHGGGAPEIGWTCYGNTVQEDNVYRWRGGGSEPMYLDAVGSGSCQHNGNTSRPPRPNVGNTIGLFQRFKPDPSGGSSLIVQLNGAPLSMEIPEATYGSNRFSSARLSLDVNTSGSVRVTLTNSYNGANYYKELYHPYSLAFGSWRYVQAEATFNASSVTLRLRIDGQAWQEQTFSGAFPAIAPNNLPWNPTFPYIEWPLPVQAAFAIGLSDIQAYETKTPKHNIYEPSFAPNAILDEGLNRLWAVPEFPEAPAWDLLRSLVTTEFGSLFVDELGRVVFRNMTNSRASRTVPDLELSSDKVSAVSITDASDNIVNVITGSVQSYAITGGAAFDANRDTLYFDRSNDQNLQLDVVRDLDQFRVKDYATNGIRPYWPQVRGMVWPIYIGRNALPYVHPDQWNNDEFVLHGVGGVDAENGNALVGDDTPTVDVWPDARNSLYIAVFNQDFGKTLQLSNGLINDLNTVGSSVNNRTLKYCLKVRGAMLEAQKEFPWRVDKPSSITEDGYLPYEIAKNEWTQTLDSMRAIAAALLDDVVLNPIPLIDDITAPMDQRVQLGDTVRIKDVGPLGGSLMAVVTGINRRVSPEGATDTYSLKLIFQPSSWILGDPTYSILGQTTILAENVDN